MEEALEEDGTLPHRMPKVAFSLTGQVKLILSNNIYNYLTVKQWDLPDLCSNLGQ